PVTSADVDAATNRFVTAGANPVYYDAAGNVTRDERFRMMSYGYDANGRQTSASLLNGTNGTNSTYDGLGQRVRQQVVDLTRHFVYDAFGKLVSEYEVLPWGEHRWERDHLFRGGQEVATDESPSWCWKSVEQFVRDFYAGALARQPNSGELSYWKDRLVRGQARGGGALLQEAQALGEALFTSADYAARNRVSDRDYVYDLYKAYLQREPDTGGWNWWTSVVPSDGRYNVRQGFALSMEFGHDVAWLCETAGPGGVRYLLTDQQGTTRVVTNEAGGVVSRHDELPFGEQVWAGAGQRTAGQGYGQTDGARQQWALMEWEKATGLQHTWWRKYDPWAGRWTSPDPVNDSLNIDDPQTFNRYAYVRNDPVNLTDPTGLYWAIDWGSCRAEVVSNGEGGLRFTGREICSLTWVPEYGPIMPQQPPDRFPCPPTGEELAKNPKVKAALDKAFEDSGFRTPGVHEEGGWIYMDEGGNIRVERAPKGGGRGVNLNNPPEVPGHILVGDFHTHPYQKGDPMPNGQPGKITVDQRGPSPPDKEGNALAGVPGLIRSPQGTKPYGPKRRGSDPKKAGTPNSKYGAYPGNTADTRRRCRN
ncbi:MAG TPA: DUF4214 domain-containing protein, partial [Pyrinomonadaceae bacterium]